MKKITIEDFKWGLEHEFPLLKEEKNFCDFSNTTFFELETIIQKLPEYQSDYDSLRVGDLGIKSKRWYVESFERFDATGNFLYAIPKGIEIRTPLANSLTEAVSILKTDLDLWNETARVYGYTPARVSFNPIQTKEFIPDPPENDWEKKLRAGTAEYLHMLTYGPDINFSCSIFNTRELIDIGEKLTFYSPYIVPFSFSSPFYKGELWGGLSRRTYYRTGPRPAVSIFLPEKVFGKGMNISKVVRKARIESEVGRIEFKAFDMITNLDLYEALGTLLLGLVLDETLLGRLAVPNRALHQRSAEFGFANSDIREGSKLVLDKAKEALPVDKRSILDPLYFSWRKNYTPAHKMIEVYNENRSILEAII